MGSYQEFDKPKAQPAKKQVAGWIIFLIIAVGAGGVFLLKLWWDRRQIERGEATIEQSIRLDDGTMVAIESVTLRERRRDPNTDQEEDIDTIHWRLRAFTEATGAVTGRKVTEDHPTCKAARGGRIWCRWDAEVRLLDSKLAEVGSIAAGKPGESFEVDVSGELVLMGVDGTPERYDPATMKLTRGDGARPVKTRGPVSLTSMVTADGGFYELSVKRGQLRATLVRSGKGRKKGQSKFVAPKESWLADGFLADANGAPGDALLTPDGFFLVHREATSDDSPRRVTRLTFDGKLLWTVPVPEAVQSGALDPDGVVLSGRSLSVKLSLVDGSKLWQTQH